MHNFPPVVPSSRFRRELNKWIRFVNTDDTLAVHISRNGEVVQVFMARDVHIIKSIYK